MKYIYHFFYAILFFSVMSISVADTLQAEPPENNENPYIKNVNSADKNLPNMRLGQYSMKFESGSAVTIEQENIIDFSGTFTVEFWIKPENLSGRNPVFSTRSHNVSGAFQIEVGTGHSGTARISVSGHNAWIFDSKSHQITEGGWVHVAYVRTGHGADDQKMYINGEEIEADHKQSYEITNNSHPLKFGRNYTHEQYEGYLTEIRIWDTARSKWDIKNNMKNSLDPRKDNMIGYWVPSIIHTDKITDISVNENDGSFTSISISDQMPGILVDGIVGLSLPGSGTHSIDNTIKVNGMSMVPIDMTLTYNSSRHEYHIYGSMKFPLMEDGEVTANLGTSSHPGLVISHGRVESVNMSISDNFKLNGLEIDTDDLGVNWNHYNNTYRIHGDASFSVDGEDLDADFGTMSDPGIVLKGNHLETLNVNINADFKVGGLELKTKDMRMDYESSSSSLMITGEAEIKEIFDVKVDFGEDGQDGLYINTSDSGAAFHLGEVTIEVDDLKLGTVNLKELKVKFNDHGLEEATVIVVLEGADEIGGTLVFDENPMKLQKVDVYYRADNLAEGIEIFEGVQLAYVNGELKNLDKPHDLKVHADIQPYAGEGLTYDGYSLTAIQSGETITADKNGINISAGLNFGALRHGNGWSDFLGKSSVDFSINFPKKTVRGAMHNELPASFAFIGVDEALFISPHNLAIFADVRFFVPGKIPFIGGKTLASVDGAFHYWYKHHSGGYAAAWTTAHVGKIHKTVGARFNFHNKHIESIGSKHVSAIKKDYKWALHHGKQAKSLSHQEIDSDVHTFTVDQNTPDFVMVEANWHTPVDTVLINVTGPEGFYETTRIFTTNHADSTALPEFDLETNMSKVVNDTSAYFIVTTPTLSSHNDLDKYNQPSMIHGRYMVTLSYLGNSPDSSSVTAHQHWQEPEIELEVTKNSSNRYDIDMNFWSSLPDSTEILVFVNDSLSTNNGKAIANVFPSDFDNDNFGSAAIEYTPDFVADNDSLYFYVIINDGVNPPLKSSITEAHHHIHDINGTIHFPPEADSLKSGIRVFLDLNGNGSYDSHTSDEPEPYGVSLQNGDFHVMGVENGTFDLHAILPRGYRIKGTESRFDSIKVSFNGNPTNLDLEIETYNE